MKTHPKYAWPYSIAGFQLSGEVQVDDRRCGLPAGDVREPDLRHVRHTLRLQDLA